MRGQASNAAATNRVFMRDELGLFAVGASKINRHDRGDRMRGQIVQSRAVAVGGKLLVVRKDVHEIIRCADVTSFGHFEGQTAEELKRAEEIVAAVIDLDSIHVANGKSRVNTATTRADKRRETDLRGDLRNEIRQDGHLD